MIIQFSLFFSSEKASCELRVERTAIPFQEVVLTCQVFGVPAPNVTRWTKDGVLINLGSANIERKEINQGEQLNIESFNLTYAGNYSCHVDNNLTSGSCSVTLPGKYGRIMVI